jgi:hypothetical protein
MPILAESADDSLSAAGRACCMFLLTGRNGYVDLFLDRRPPTTTSAGLDPTDSCHQCHVTKNEAELFAREGYG